MDSARHRLGQWFTPPAVAEVCISLTFAGRRPRRVLDPSCGDGVFLQALKRRCPAAEIVGVDIDPVAADAARASGCRVITGDFFASSETGFDAIVGNPPYVRTERLAAKAKERVKRAVASAHGVGDTSWSGRGDLSVAFVWAALSRVKAGGRLGFVVSSALLDAGYAQNMWKALLPFGRLRALVESPDERWFGEAAVNTSIIVVERTPADASVPCTVYRLTRPIAEVTQSLAQCADVREADATAPETWASAARSSKTWFDLAAQLGRRLVPLGSIADIRRGVTSGANDVFYLKRAKAQAFGLEDACLSPLFRSPRESGDGILIDHGNTPMVAVTAHTLKGHPRVAAYVRERSHVAERPTLRGRAPWWSLPHKKAQVFLTKAYAARFVQRYAEAPLVADQRAYLVWPKADPMLMAAILNSSVTAFALESLGRASLGEGALEWTVSDALTLPVMDPSEVDGRGTRRAFASLLKRPIGSVWDEATRPDRTALDQAVLGVDAGVLPALQEALCDAVARRVGRAARAQRA